MGCPVIKTQSLNNLFKNNHNRKKKFGNCLDAKCLRRVATLVALGLIAGNGNLWWTFEREE